MTTQENVNVDVPTKEDKEEQQIEAKTQQRLERKREEYKEMFVKHYNIPEDSDFLDTLVDREMASAKSFDKLMKQKKKYRATAQEKKDNPEKKDNNEDNSDDKKEKQTSSFDRLRDLEKKKATEEFVQGLVKDYPDKFKDKESVSEAYQKTMAEYKETGEETNRSDFKANLTKAFKVAHPDIYEEEIKKKERERLLEDNVDIPDVIGEKEDKPKKGERKFLKGTKIDPAKDWFKKDK